MFVTIKVLAFASAALTLVSAAPPTGAPALAPNSTLISTGVPPARYRKDNAAVVYFVDDVSPLCGRASTPGFVIVACARGNQIAMPNPCRFAASEYYARIMCHELGHVSGWPGTHGD